MNKLILGAAAALSLAMGVVAPSIAEAHPHQAQTTRSDWREARQEQRIRVAQMRGQLTPFEYRRLQAGQTRIDRMQRIAERDGVVTPFEQRRIERAQNIENQRIMRFAHNRASANGRWRRF